ncbi:alpha-methylacyl-CoA racemase [Allonocardiopsis opalescens]|uniref:Alpha-methylacyl-CoA racemase n=1 Tax=Allonocardiopsis opalescens TaxID=1144618 RepID=A0A2T0QD84_9ACTN|nr:alpha-methylacyl-CoA racemase [Allonocardiopsis opalescens]
MGGDAHREGEDGSQVGPLDGIRVLEFAGIGPGPMAAMLLADLGADVLRVDRPEAPGADGGPAARTERPQMSHGRPVLGLDLKSPAGRDRALRLAGAADVLVEGFRPGVMERLGLGPDDCWAVNPGLVFGRMTGWGQDGPLARRVGHDLNYISLNGALHGFRRAGSAPVPPANLVGDFGGGALFLVTGVLAALIERGSSGRGQVVDAAMVDGSAFLTAMIHDDLERGLWTREPGTNYLDTGAPWYDVYECADGGHVSVGAIEDRFYAALLAGLELDPAGLPAQWDREGWPRLRAVLAERFRARSRDDWARLFEGTEACVQPVLSPSEAPGHPHIAARGSVLRRGGATFPGAAPRFSRTPGRVTRDPAEPTPSLPDTLRAWGLEDV